MREREINSAETLGSKPVVSGPGLLAVRLNIRGECPVLATRTGSAKTNHPWLVGTELTPTDGSDLERRALDRITERSGVFLAGASQRVSPGIVRNKLATQSFPRSWEPMVPTRVGTRNCYHHYDQNNRNDAQHLNGRKAFSFSCSHLVGQLLLPQQKSEALSRGNMLSVCRLVPDGLGLRPKPWWHAPYESGRKSKLFVSRTV